MRDWQDVYTELRHQGWPPLPDSELEQARRDMEHGLARAIRPAHDVRYTPFFGERAFREQDMVPFWDRLQQEGLIPALFGDAEPHAEDFLAFVRSPDTLFFFGQVEHQPAGFFWLDSLRPGMAFVHHVFFWRMWSRARKLAPRMLHELLRTGDGRGGRLLTALWGKTPLSNTLGIRFMRRLGFVELGVVKAGERFLDEGYDKDTAISILTMDSLILH